jgi:flagellar hook-associated protein 3 FlgL
MRVTGGSDLARLQMLQRQAFATRNRLDVAGQELTTNLKASRFEATGGNLTRLFALERALDRNAVFSETISLTELRLDVMQESLGRMLTPVEDLSLDLIQTVGQGDYSSAMLHARTARQTFSDAVGILNTQVAGQSLFAGNTTDSPALAPAAAILADLDALAGGAATAADAIAAIDAYFAKVPPGAFYTTGYLGAGAGLTPVEIGEGQRLDYGVKAEEDRLVAVLRSQALAAVVAGGAFAGDQAAQMTLLGEAGDRMLAAKEGLMDLRSEVGIRQETVERAKAERVSEHDTLDLARARIIATDPLEAASTYQMLQLQLESIYTVTSRLANLRYLTFMR